MATARSHGTSAPSRRPVPPSSCLDIQAHAAYNQSVVYKRRGVLRNVTHVNPPGDRIWQFAVGVALLAMSVMADHILPEPRRWFVDLFFGLAGIFGIAGILMSFLGKWTEEEWEGGSRRLRRGRCSPYGEATGRASHRWSRTLGACVRSAAPSPSVSPSSCSSRPLRLLVSSL